MEDEGSANTAKSPVAPAVTAGNKERRKPFFRRVSTLLSHHISPSVYESFSLTTSQSVCK